MAEKILDIRKKEKPTFAALIEKKRDGGEFTADEIRQIVDSVPERFHRWASQQQQANGGEA